MIRRIITIDEEKCNGCGVCADACHEGAISIVDGKAKLLREDYCDGLGDCLPACPMNAISFEEREAPAYNEAAVLAAKKSKEAPLPCGCPGSACQSIQHSAPVGDVYVPSELSEISWFVNDILNAYRSDGVIQRDYDQMHCRASISSNMSDIDLLDDDVSGICVLNLLRG